MLSSRLLRLAVIRRWVRHSTETSNLRNGVGRPGRFNAPPAAMAVTTPPLCPLSKSAPRAAHWVPTTLAVQELRGSGVDIRAETARMLGISSMADLDFRL
ncbi:beta-lactamase/transpeptidase-like protein [Apiospora sp. TS-2023a]